MIYKITIEYEVEALTQLEAFRKIREGKINHPDDIRRALHTYPMKVPDVNNINLDNGVMEVTDSPTGCMLIKREVFIKMMEEQPDKFYIPDYHTYDFKYKDKSRRTSKIFLS